MASGKNEATRILEGEGFACVDADKVAHEALEERKEEVLEAFKADAAEKSMNIVTADGKIARKELAKMVFSSSASLERLEKILYPHVEAKLEAFIESHKNQNIALNATNLYKLPDLMRKCACIFFVDAPLILRLFRAVKRDKASPADILRRFIKQRNLLSLYRNFSLPLEIIQNNGGKEKLEKKVLETLSSL